MPQHRPTMHTTNSSGMKVDILNNEAEEVFEPYHQSQYMERSTSGSNSGSSGASPPPLSRAASADSGVPHLPPTPRDAYPSQPWNENPYSPQSKRELYPLGPLNDSPDERTPPPFFVAATAGPLPPILPLGGVVMPPRTSLPATGPSIPGKEKKHPCRLAAQYNCNAMFTTSGHASRHAKIHDSAKRITCSHPGCSKKFTRLDNMNQHLGTHRPGGQKRKAIARREGRLSSSISSASSRESSQARDCLPVDGGESSTSDAYMTGVETAVSPKTAILPLPRFSRLPPQMNDHRLSEQYPPHRSPQMPASLDLLAAAAEQLAKSN